MSTHICPICHESRDPTRARFEHRRLGLDEPPEPILCRCRDPATILDSIASKIRSVNSIITTIDNTTMETLPHPSPNMVVIESISNIPAIEVELRLDPRLSMEMFTKMDSGLFTFVERRTIREIGCTWWTGRRLNANAKVRQRSNGEAVVKIPRTRTTVAPGYILATSEEYGFDGIIKDPTYVIDMTEIRYATSLVDTETNVETKIILMARRYANDNRFSYAAEFEIEGVATNSMVRRIISMSAGIVGHPTKMRHLIDQGFMSDVRSADHVVMDVPTMDGLKGRFMAKADGIKVFVFCYGFGFVITLTDPDLTTISTMTTINSSPLNELTNRPDVVVAEMLIDGSLVYIDTLAMDGHRLVDGEIDRTVCPVRTEKPQFIYRRWWNRMPTKTELNLEPTPSDGMVLVNRFRTMRLKEPTVDLLYRDGRLHSVENGVMIPVANGDSNMETNAVYEMDLVKDRTTNAISLVKPRPRVTKKVPNSMDVVRRAIASANRDPMVDAALLDITSMSFSMRERVYTMARAKASKNKRVIVTFGIGRFQEWRQMIVDGMSYIAIDPNIDTETLNRRMKRMTVMPYDFNSSFNTQVISISKRGSTVLWAKCRSEYFIDRVMPARVMVMTGIPAVFSFSISYHIGVINRLVSEGITVLGCGFIHDSIPASGIGRSPVTIRPKGSRIGPNSEIIATFGKSTYIEPFLSRSSVPGLVLVKDEMPTLWRMVDSTTMEIMERAVIMYAS